MKDFSLIFIILAAGSTCIWDSPWNAWGPRFSNELPVAALFFLFLAAKLIRDLSETCLMGCEKLSVESYYRFLEPACLSMRVETSSMAAKNSIDVRKFVILLYLKPTITFHCRTLPVNWCCLHREPAIWSRNVSVNHSIPCCQKKGLNAPDNSWFQQTTGWMKLLNWLAWVLLSISAEHFAVTQKYLPVNSGADSAW